MLLAYTMESRAAALYPTVYKTVPHSKEFFKPRCRWCRSWSPTTLSSSPLFSFVPLCNALLLSDSNGKMTASNQNKPGPQAISLCSQSVVGDSLAISFVELSDSLSHL